MLLNHRRANPARGRRADRAAGILPLLVVGGCAAGPSDLALEGVGPEGGPYEKDVVVVTGEPTSFEGRFVNEGGEARAPVLSFADLACLGIGHDFAADTVAPGEALTFPLTVTVTDDCHVQTIIDWFIDCETGSSRGTFNVVRELAEG